MYEFFSDVADALKERWGKALIGRNVIVFNDDPQAWAVNFILSADGAGELSDFHGMRRFRCEFEIGEVAGFLGNGFVVLAKNFEEHPAGIVDQIAKTLRDQHAVNVARSGVFEVDEIVVWKRFFERNFDGDRGLIRVRNDSKWHNKVLHYASHFG